MKTEKKFAENNIAPLHQRLKTEILRKIEAGEYEVGQRIPSTSELCSSYNVSTITVRRAITDLITEGVLQGLPGKGVFIVSNSGEKEPTGNKLAGIVFNGSKNDAFFLDLFRGIENVLCSHGYHLVSAASNNNSEKECRILVELKEKGVEGFIVIPTVMNRTPAADETMRMLIKQDFPIVFLDRKIAGFSVDYVTTDNESCGYHITRYLLNLGHSQIALVSSCAANTSEERLLGYKRALADSGIPVDDRMTIKCYREGEDEDVGYQSTLELLDLPTPPTAVFAINDVVALGVYRACHEMGVNIPNELSVVGYDNLFFAGSLNPPLTTMHQPKREMGQKAGELLLRRIKGETGNPAQAVLKSRFIRRGSCAKQNKEQNISQSLVTAERG